MCVQTATLYRHPTPYSSTTYIPYLLKFSLAWQGDGALLPPGGSRGSLRLLQVTGGLSQALSLQSQYPAHLSAA